MHRLVALTCTLAIAGCARDDGEAEVPAACKESAGEIIALVRDAEVSDCLPSDASVGDVQLVGGLMVEAAQQLGKERDAEALRYLVGAVRQASYGAQGIYAELLRRLEQELRAARTSG